MNALNIEKVQIGKNNYVVELLNPIDAITWGSRMLTMFGPVMGKALVEMDFTQFKGVNLASVEQSDLADKLQGVLAPALIACGSLNGTEVGAALLEAVQRCYTPQNESLSDTVAFNRWFREHPGDLYMLGVQAMRILVKDFFPLGTGIAATVSQMMH